MRATTVDRVDGVGHQIPADEETEFDPRRYEQALHGVQEMIMSVIRLDNEPDKEYENVHEKREENGEKKLLVKDETMLHSICTLVPNGWDLSVVTDISPQDFYYVRASADCGGGVLVYVTFSMSEGYLNKMDVDFNPVWDTSEWRQLENINSYYPSSDLASAVRVLEDAVTQGYTYTIETTAKAHDYCGSKNDINSKGQWDYGGYHDRGVTTTQKDWANVCGKTQQTVSNNYTAAKKEIDAVGEPYEKNPLGERGPALVEGDESDEATENGIRLV